MSGYAEELAFAQQAANDAATIATGMFGSDVARKIKEDGTWATEADVATEAALRGAIAAAYPDHNILGEEEGLTAAGGGPPVDGAPMWVIDPIDGTNNFIAKIPIWATMLGLRVGEETVLGVVHAPALGETYDAAIGAGARMNGAPITVDDITDLSEALVIHAGVHRFRPAGLEDMFMQLIGAARRDRGFGDFWGHVLVARGAGSVMIEPSLSLWDVAALQPIVSEAGGRLTQIDGSPWSDQGSVLTTNGKLHDEIVAHFDASLPARDRKARPR